MSLSDWALYVILPMLTLSVVLAFVRLVRGASLPDRVVALDMMSMVGIAFIATYAIATGEPAFLDAAIVLALVSFLSTVAFAYYIERRV